MQQVFFSFLTSQSFFQIPISQSGRVYLEHFLILTTKILPHAYQSFRTLKAFYINSLARLSYLLTPFPPRWISVLVEVLVLSLTSSGILFRHPDLGQNMRFKCLDSRCNFTANICGKSLLVVLSRIMNLLADTK